MIRNKSAYKYENPCKGLHENVQTRKNGSFTLQIGAVTTRVIILRINPYKQNREYANVFNK